MTTQAKPKAPLVQNLLPFDYQYVKLVIKRAKVTAKTISKNCKLLSHEELSILNNVGILKEMRNVARHYEYKDTVLPSIYVNEFADNLEHDFPYYLAFSAICYLDKPKRVRTKTTAKAA